VILGQPRLFGELVLELRDASEAAVQRVEREVKDGDRKGHQALSATPDLSQLRTMLKGPLQDKPENSYTFGTADPSRG
jgi:hypothetical protein